MRVQPWVSPATRPTMVVPAHGLATARLLRNPTGRRLQPCRRLALLAPPRSPPRGVARGRDRGTVAAEAVPESGRRVRDPAPARCRHQLFGEVSACSGQVRVLRGRDQDRVRGEASPFLARLRGRTRLRHSPVRWAATAQADDALTPFAAFFLHSPALSVSPAGPRAPLRRLTPRRCRPGRRSSRRTPRTRVTCRTRGRSGCRGRSSTRCGCTRDARRLERGARP